MHTAASHIQKWYLRDKEQMNQHAATWGCMQNASNSNTTTIWNSYLLFLKTIWDIVKMHKNREMKSLIRIPSNVST